MTTHGSNYDSTCYELVTHRHSLTTMQAVDGGLCFCMAGELDKGTACTDRKREREERRGDQQDGLEYHRFHVIWFVNIFCHLCVECITE